MATTGKAAVFFGPGKPFEIRDVKLPDIEPDAVLIKVSLANVELLTLQIRLLVCSIDKAEQIGLNWWRYDQSLVHPPASNGHQDEVIGRLEARIAELESQLQQRATTDAPAPTTRPSRRRG